MKQLYLIDAYAFIFRAYYAFAKNPRINTKGQDTSAIFGFVNTISDILRNFKPSHIVVVFDPPGGSFRKDFFPEYKAQREATPEPIIFAVPHIKAFLEAMGIEVIEVPRYEADDVIGTMSVMAERDGFEVIMATPDKDYGQLVTPKVSILAPQRGGGYDEIGPRDVCEKWKIAEPRQLIDILALMGDSADNFPGVPGIGPVMAAKLIAEYGSVETMIEHAHEIKGSAGDKVRNNIENALVSKRLATIALDAPVEFKPQAYEVVRPNLEALRAVLEPLELRTAMNNMQRYYEQMVPTQEQTEQEEHKEEPILISDTEDFGELFASAEEQSSKPVPPTVPNYNTIVLKDEALSAFLARAEQSKKLYLYALTIGTDNIQKDIPALAFMLEEGDDVYYLPLNGETASSVYQLQAHCNKSEIMLIAHDLKTQLLALRAYGWMSECAYEDTMIAHYLLMPDMGHSIEALAQHYLSMSLMGFDELIAPQKASRLSVAQIDAERLKSYVVSRVIATRRLHDCLIQKLEEQKQLHLLRELEMPLMPILMRMELEGVRLDEVELSRQDKLFQEQMSSLESEIQELAGETFNVNSPKQIGDILFEKLQLDAKAKKTKSGTYTTSEEVLEKYRDKHPIIGKILDYRGLKKLHSTYITALPSLADITGHVHTSFNQTIAATGRLSSSNPNIQNIPIRTEQGRAIRAAFIPEEGCTFLSADYSQIELRLMAHFSGDEHLIGAFVSGHDIHQATAARIANVSLDEVTSDMRRNAKTANFGIIYGISAFGLAERLGISRSEAKDLITGYFASYPGVKAYMDNVVAKARADRFVETIMGRRRYLTDIDSNNAIVRGYAERNAINAPLQGTAADIIKVAMIAIDKEIREKNLKSRMILQVHDELNFNVPFDELELMQELVHRCMLAAGKGLKVPLEVGMGHGANWLVAH